MLQLSGICLRKMLLACLLEKLKEEVDDFNDHGKNIKISYAYGWAFSDDYTECTLRTLFDRADKHMYENKRLVKLAQQ